MDTVSIFFTYNLSQPKTSSYHLQYNFLVYIQVNKRQASRDNRKLERWWRALGRERTALINNVFVLTIIIISDAM